MTRTSSVIRAIALNLLHERDKDAHWSPSRKREILVMLELFPAIVTLSFLENFYPIIARISRVGVRTGELRQKMTHMLHNTSWCHLHLLLLTYLFRFLTPPKSCTLNALCGLRFRPFLKSYLVELTFC